MRAWTIRDSLELYQVPQWGRGFFGVDEQGNLVVQPRGPEGPAIPLPTLVEDLRQRGLRTPLLLRFSDILAARVRRLADAFRTAAAEYGYKGRFRGVYPINFKISKDSDRDELLEAAEEELRRRGAVREGDLIILTIGEPIGKSGGTNTLKIVKVGGRKKA